MSPTWDILIPSMAHRTDKLRLLLDELETQIWFANAEDVGVRVFRDNLEHTQATKCQALLDSTSADYVCFIEDDDWIHERYVELIMDALEQDPDCVGWRMRFTESGVLQLPVVHSLNVEHNEWIPGVSEPEVLQRKVTHLNPIRTSIARVARFDGDFTMDRRWSNHVLMSGLLQREVFIDQDVYHYRRDAKDSIQSGAFHPMSDPGPNPNFEWVTWL